MNKIHQILKAKIAMLRQNKENLSLELADIEYYVRLGKIEAALSAYIDCLELTGGKDEG